MVDVYSTCPSSRRTAPDVFRRRVAEAGRWSEDADCLGMLVYTDNTVVDPWGTAQYLLERTSTLIPLVAVQPTYMHPYTAARKVCTLSHLYGRRLHLNVVAGGSRPEQRALGCDLDHDERYARLIEYSQVMLRLLIDPDPVTHRGTYYELAAAALQPGLPAGLLPKVFVAGSSPACRAAEEALRAVRLAYPRAIAEYDADPGALSGAGIGMGILARDTSEEAWALAARRFPSDRMGEAMRKASRRIVDAQWLHTLVDDGGVLRQDGSPYWLYPFLAFHEYCPYLVGSHAEVGTELARYLDLGVTTVILSVPHGEDDLHHAQLAVRHAERISGHATDSVA